MSRFARTTEEAFLRRKELREKDRKQGYQETFLLYQIILLHSWETGVCKVKLPKLCVDYDLDYHNSYRRLKILRERGWVVSEGEYIRPIIIHQKDRKVGVIFTPTKDVKITPVVKITPNNGVEITPNECKNYTKIDENGVNLTPQAQATSAPSTLSSDSRFKLDLNDQIETTTTATSNGHLSKFSLEECLSYTEVRINRGEKIDTPHKFARWLYQTGTDDVFIRATLYPPQETETVETETPAATAPDGEITADRLKALEILNDLLAVGEEIESMRHWYADDWDWLMRELCR